MQEKIITSKQNKYVSQARLTAVNKKFRRKSRLFIIEGIRLLGEAVESNFPLEYVLVSDKLKNNDQRGIKILNNIKDMGIEVFTVDHRVFLTIARTETPQGVVAVAKQPVRSWIDLNLECPESFILVVDGVQDPGNLGTMIRTAEAVGARGIITTPSTVDVYNPKVVRSSMGSIFRIPILAERSIKEIIKVLEDYRVQLIVARVDADKIIYDVEFEGALAIVVGNENHGPSEAFKGIPVRIPCKIESLNVSVAAAVLLYERVRRQYQNSL
ncbi:MAG: RNA methyltransferase, TrmH family, group 3 [Clostridia bacterium 41_269]|nr:MAG: RNA methyltransferase, TrmH family, group 3 [Clostridia bacterium 41_269]